MKYMNRLTTACAVVVLFFVVLGATPAFGQQGVDRFLTADACVSAVEAGTAVWYQPSFFDHRLRAPSRPVAITRPLEERACVDMWIVGGWGWIPQPGVPQMGRGAPRFDFDAEGKPIRRSDCGNRVRAIRYVPTPSPPPSPPPVPEMGCIKVLKEAFGPDQSYLRPVAQFRFSLDDEEFVFSDAEGNARFEGVIPGEHRVAEMVPEGWELLSVTPVAGLVQVQAGEACAAVVFKNRQIISPPVPKPVATATIRRPKYTPEPPAQVKKGKKRWWLIPIIAGAGVAVCAVAGCFGGGGGGVPPLIKPATPAAGSGVLP